MANWKFAKAIDENEEFRIDHLNIWSFYWHCVNKKVEVVGPYEGQIYYFKQYEIMDGDKKVEFVAGGISKLQSGNLCER